MLRFVPGLGAPTAYNLFSDEKDFDVPEDFPTEYESIGGSDLTDNADGSQNGDDAKVF